MNLGKKSPADPSLSVQVSQPAPCQQRLQISVSSHGVQPVRDLIVQEFRKEAAIAGFRKGKAPRQLVEQKYPSEIREETVRRLTRQVLEQVTEEKKLKPVGPFEVIKLDFDDQQGLKLEAQVEVEPEFKLADYKGLAASAPGTDVSAEDIQQALAQLQESAAQLVPVEEGKPKEKKVPALDDDFAKDVGFEKLEDLRQHLEAKLREQKQQQRRGRIEQSLTDALLGRHQFEVPPKLVERQAEKLTRDFQMRLLLSGVPEDQATQELAKYTEQLRTNAIRLVKLTFILDRIAEKESLSVTQDELVDRLWKLSKRWNKDPAQVRQWLDSQGLWPSVISSIRQDKTMALLADSAKISEESKSLAT